MQQINRIRLFLDCDITLLLGNSHYIAYFLVERILLNHEYYFVYQVVQASVYGHLTNTVRSKQFIPLLTNENGEQESMVQRVYRQITTVERTLT